MKAATSSAVSNGSTTGSVSCGPTFPSRRAPRSPLAVDVRPTSQTESMTRTGAERTDVAVLWPSRLLRPQLTRLVYLDLNQWIGLAKAAVGHRDGKRFSTALEAVLAHRDGWTYVIGGPLM